MIHCKYVNSQRHACGQSNTINVYIYISERIYQQYRKSERENITVYND